MKPLLTLLLAPLLALALWLGLPPAAAARCCYQQQQEQKTHQQQRTAAAALFLKKCGFLAQSLIYIMVDSRQP